MCVGLGLVVKLSKSELQPTQTTTFLGFSFNFAQAKLFPLTEKLLHVERVAKETAQPTTPAAAASRITQG